MTLANGGALWPRKVELSSSRIRVLGRPVDKDGKEKWMTRRLRLTVVGIGVLVAASGWSFVPAQANQSGSDVVNVTIEEGAIGDCVATLPLTTGPTDKVPNMAVHTKRGHTVEWVILNNCYPDVGVTVYFLLVNSPVTGGDYLDPAHGITARCFAPKTQTCSVTLTVRDDAVLGSYDYLITRPVPSSRFVGFPVYGPDGVKHLYPLIVEQ
jgi:hypothetical protein